MLVSAKEMLEKARDGKYAVGQFNINNLEWTAAGAARSILTTYSVSCWGILYSGRMAEYRPATEKPADQSFDL